MASGEKVLRVVHDATREILRAESASEVAAVVQRLIEGLGGTVTDDASAAGAFDADISFGTAAPAYPVASPGSAERRQIEAVLPRLIEDATRALDVVGRISVAESGVIEPTTGVFTTRAITRIISRLWAGDTVACIRLDGVADVDSTSRRPLVNDFLRLIRDEVRLEDHVGRLEEDVAAVVLRHTDSSGTQALLTRLRRRWSSIRPREMTFSAGIAEVGSSGGDPTLAAAQEALAKAAASGGDVWGVAQPREDGRAWDPSLRSSPSSRSQQWSERPRPR